MVSRSDLSQPAIVPAAGLTGLDPEWSHLIDVVDADGVRRGFHVLDTGPVDDQIGTVLCVHGNPTWSYLWRGLLAETPDRWRVVALDQLGMGWSERLAEPRLLEQRIADLGALTSTMQLNGPVVTVAHDWGGPVSLGWALSHRDQVVGVVLTNTAVHQPPGSRAPGLIRLARTPGVLRAVCELTPAFVRGTTALSRPALPAEVRRAFVAPYRTRARRRAVADFVADIPLTGDHPSMAALDEIARGISGLEVPTLLAWGPADPVFSDRYLRDLVQRLPHADVHRYEGASHLVTEDASRAIDDIREWVDRLTTTSDAPHNVGEPGEDFEVDEVEVGETRRVMGAELARKAADPQAGAETALAELSGRGRRITWQKLGSVVDELAAGLWAAGVRPGERVALLVPPGADLAAAVYACWRIGAVIVVADAGLGVRGLARALRGAWPEHVIAVDRGLVAARALGVGGRRFAVGMSSRKARLLGAEATLVDLARAGRGAQLPKPPSPHDEAAVLFTSGATGPAKGVVYRHTQIEANRDALARHYQVGDDDRLVAAFAPFALYGPALGIASAVPDMDVTRPATLTAPALADAIAAVGATMVWASPASLRNVWDTRDRLLPAQREALTGVRLLMSAGAPVPLHLLTDVRALFPGAQARTPYGMTEVLPVTDISLDERVAAGELGSTAHGVCVGRPVKGVSVQVDPLDHNGRPSGGLTREPQVTGEIVVCSAWMKDRYDRLWGVEAASARGSHRTGDVGHLDEQGRLWIEGRLQHVITTARGPVTPVGLEQRVETLPGVSSAAAVGVGPMGAQVTVLVVVPDDQRRRSGPLANPELTAAVRDVLGAEVAAVLCMNTLPVDVRHNSKVDRNAVARWATAVLS